jgi:hypothetical protein
MRSLEELPQIIIVLLGQFVDDSGQRPTPQRLISNSVKRNDTCEWLTVDGKEKPISRSSACAVMWDRQVTCQAIFDVLDSLHPVVIQRRGRQRFMQFSQIRL